MKVIVAGSRSIESLGVVTKAIEDSGFNITEIVSGRAKGVDKLGEHYGLVKNLPVKLFPADWDKHGKAAGPMRNRQMADYADAAVIVWDGVSKGTKHMIYEMNKRNKKCYIYMHLSSEFAKELFDE
jgi:hypothetical protein